MLTRVKIIIIVNLQLSVNDKKVNLMKVYAYGEDALTLWAIKNRVPEILGKLGDETKVDNCKIFFRPSFGRGGKGTSNFGEFDFIILSDDKLYLGESKWDGAKKAKAKVHIKFKQQQLRRHEIFKWYIEKIKEILKEECWSTFKEKYKDDFSKCFGPKEIPDLDKKGLKPLLIENLITVLKLIAKKPNKIVDVLLYFYNGKNLEDGCKVTNDNSFECVSVDYNDDNKEDGVKNNLIKIELQ